MASDPGTDDRHDFSSELIRQLGQELEVQPRQSSGLATPMYLPQSPLRPPSTGSEASLSVSARSLHADKMRRFRRYLQFINVNAVRTGGEDSDDADEFYNDEIFSKRHETRYVQRPFAFSEKEDVEIEDGAKNAYEIYDVHREQRVLAIDDTSAPAMKYDDGLQFEELSMTQLQGVHLSKYKCNLCECYGRFMFLGCMSKILVLEEESPSGYITTKPFITTATHRAASTWGYFPHAINHLRICQFQGKDVLMVCIDDGRLRMYDLSNIGNGIDIPMMLEITMNSSVWGIHTMGDFIAVSDNSMMVTLFHVNGTHVKYGQTLQLLHNVPSVEILDIKEEAVHVVCTSISGELMRFEFDCSCASKKSALLVQWPLELKLTEMKTSHPPTLIISRVRDRTQLEENGWCVVCVDEKYFLEVNDPKYLGGKDKINCLDILQRSRILGLMSNHMVTSDLGGAAWYETIHLQTHYDEERRVMNRLNSVTDKCSRIKKSYFELSTEEMTHDGNTSRLPEFPDKFIVVTTMSKVGLYRAHRLICNSDTGDLYEFALNEEIEASNRLCIVRVIPELSAVVTVSPAGFMTVFRLVKHRGLHALREEHVTPKSMEEFDHAEVETIVGLGVRRVDSRTFWLYLPYTSGMVVKYELRENAETGLDLALL